MAKVSIRSKVRYYYLNHGIVEREIFYHISSEDDLTSAIETLKHYIEYCDGVILINREAVQVLDEDEISLKDQNSVDLRKSKVAITGLNFRLWFLDSFKYAIEQLNKAGVMLTIEEKVGE